MEVWDKDTNIDDDLIDRFIITMADTVLPVMNDDSGQMTVTGVKGIGSLTISYYNFTTDQIVPSSADIFTTTITITPSKTCGCRTYVHVYLCMDMTHLLTASNLICIYFGN